MSRLLTLAAVVLALYALWAGLLYAQQRHMMFPGATMRIAPARPALPRDVSSVRLETDVGRVEAWFRPSPGDAPGPVIVFAHGNLELIDDRADLPEQFAAIGYGTLLVEYPGYGRSEGHASLATLDSAFSAAHDWLLARPEVDATRIVAMGASVGTGPAARLATRRRTFAMILHAPFTRIADFAAGYGVPGFLTRDPFDNVAEVSRYDGPVLVLHGRYDDVIPYAHGVAVAGASKRATFVALECAHNDCPGDEAHYWATIASFLERSAPPRAEAP